MVPPNKNFNYECLYSGSYKLGRIVLILIFNDWGWRMDPPDKILTIIVPNAEAEMGGIDSF